MSVGVRNVRWVGYNHLRPCLLDLSACWAVVCLSLICDVPPRKQLAFFNGKRGFFPCLPNLLAAKEAMINLFYLMSPVDSLKSIKNFRSQETNKDILLKLEAVRLSHLVAYTPERMT